MNKSILLAAPLLAAFAVSPALADRDGKHGKGKGKGHHKHQVDHRGDRHDNGLHRGWYKNRWKRGDRIAWQVVQPTYYVYDYDRYDLRPAPAGYRWVRPMDDRYLLVEIATGLIVDALGY